MNIFDQFSLVKRGDIAVIDFANHRYETAKVIYADVSYNSFGHNVSYEFDICDRADSIPRYIYGFIHGPQHEDYWRSIKKLNERSLIRWIWEFPQGVQSRQNALSRKKIMESMKCK